MRDIILCDIDHTISHAAWRDHLVPKEVSANEKLWQPYYIAGDKDAPSAHMLKLLNVINYDGHYKLHYLTARPEKWKRQTFAWLMRHGFPDAPILMRPFGNHEASPFCKYSMMVTAFPDWKERVAMLLEDRADVIAVFKAAGIFCLQSHLEEVKP